MYLEFVQRHAVWKNQDPVTYISVPHVAVSVRAKWKTEIRVCPFQSTATKINIFNNFTIQKHFTIFDRLGQRVFHHMLHGELYL